MGADDGEQAFATEGAAGARMSTFDENVASSGITDKLIAEGNISNERIVELLEQIRGFIIAVLVAFAVLLFVSALEHQYDKNTRARIDNMEEVLCDLAYQIEAASDTLTVPGGCPPK